MQSIAEIEDLEMSRSNSVSSMEASRMNQSNKKNRRDFGKTIQIDDISNASGLMSPAGSMLNSSMKQKIKIKFSE